MANIYDMANCSSSSSPAETDDFSLLLQQIMLRSSSSSAFIVQKSNDLQSFRPSCSHPENQELGVQSSVLPGLDRISIPESPSWLNSANCADQFASLGASFQDSGVNVPSSSVSVGTADNELTEYDGESEECFEGVAEEAPARPTAARNQSKRSRAAEVHNMSEKRRRSRINEKMKALQNLIPNSNKTDKASMLDEAIEYLKQLQLQVQLLTIRNGVSLYPMSLPRLLQSSEISPMRMGYSEENRSSLNMNMPHKLPLNQGNSTNNLFTLLDHGHSNTKQTSVTGSAKLNASENSFGFELATQADLGSFQLRVPGFSKGICGEDELPCQLVGEDRSRTIALGFLGGDATSSIPFSGKASDLEENALEACHPWK